MPDSRQQGFEPLCPRGSDYHACGSTGFVGCCNVDVDPCVAGGSCNGDALRPMTFDKDQSSNAFTDQMCSTGLWYTCAYTIPPFIGCCTSNPCNTGTTGCPAGDLIEGSLSSKSDDAASWLSAAKLDSATTTSSGAAYTASGAKTTSSGAQISSSHGETTTSSRHGLGGGTIAGVAIGVAALLILLIAALTFYRRRKAVATNSIGQETKSVIEHTWTGMYTAPFRRDVASDVHEAPGMEVHSKGFRSSGYPGSFYSSPTPTYSPHSPPQYSGASDLEAPISTFQNLQSDSCQPAELPTPNTPFPHRQHHVRSTAPADRLGISQAFTHVPSPFSPSGHLEAHMGPDGRT